MDYKEFLSRPETLVLPYFGGPRVEAAERRLRLVGEAAEGWWEFSIEGRRARPVRRAEPADLSDRPAVRGHFAEGWLFSTGRELDRIALAPEVEPEPLARCTGRRWFTGDLLLDTIDFDDQAEEAARLALEQGTAIDQVKAVVPSLRAAFGYALAAAAARAAALVVSPREIAPHVHLIAAGGRDAATAVIAGIAETRQRYLEAQHRIAEQQRRDAIEAERQEVLIDTARRARPLGPARRADGAPDRAEAALAAAGARMLRGRRISHHQLEVTFQLQGERFICVVDAASLQVHDAGICLSGADRELTLDSLPSAINEAIETGQLHITRH